MANNLEDDIREFLNELTESKTNLERKFRLIGGCKTYGIVEVDLHKLCSHPECTTCRGFEKAFRETVQSWKRPDNTIDLNKL